MDKPLATDWPPSGLDNAGEATRLAALDSYGILDTPAEAGFDDIVLLACQICDTPVALVSLVAGDRQWFKAKVGFDPCQTPLEQSVCWHALRQPDLLVIPDLTTDPRTRANTLVTGEPHIRFYAGARLETPEGLPLGTICVIDAKPRPEGLTAIQAGALQALARQVMSQMELRRAATLRDQAEERLNLALGASGMVGIWDWDLKSDLIYADANFARIYSVDPAGAARGAPLADFLKNFHPDDLPAFRMELDRLFAGADAFSSEYRIVQPDGTIRWVLARGRLVRNASGEAIRFPGATVDITERKQAEARRLALLTLGDRLRDLDDPAEMAFVAAEIMGRTLDANRAGYGTIDAAGERVVIERDWAVPGISSIAGTHSFRDFGSFVDDLQHGAIVAIDDVRRDGRTAAKCSALEGIGIRSIVNIPMLEHGRFVALFYLHGAEVRRWNGEQIAFVRNVADRTRAAIERLRAETRLVELNAALELRVDERTRERDQLWTLSEDLLVIADYEGRLLRVSPSWTKHLGWSEEHLLNHHYGSFTHPDDLDASVDVIRRMRDTGLSVKFENRLKGHDGRWHWIAWQISPEPGGDRLTGTGRDVTAEKARQAELEIAQDSLRQSQKMEAIGQLTGGVAHDFNNLLTVIRSSIDLLKRPTLSEERRQRYIEAISDTTTRAAKLTGQLLAFARRQALKPEVFDAVQSVTAVSDMVVSLTGSRIHIETHVPDHPCLVHADPSQFDTALVNLSVNARDAMNGVGLLTITVDPARSIPERRGHAAAAGDFVAISVSDTGSGISQADLEHIFEPFFTTKGVGQGTGLGLSQVIGFAKQSGGDVIVDSTVGQGSTFTLYLPRSLGQTSQATDLDAGESLADGNGICVLVVEDNPGVGAFATQTLDELGYHSVLMANAEAALAELAATPHRFDVVFSDVVMPGMNGIELGREIRRRHPDLPVVLTSGYSHVLAQDGPHGFELLQKPYSIEQLSRILQKAVHWRRLKRVIDG